MEHEHADFRSAIRRAIEIVGSQRALAQACSVKQGDIWQAINKRAKMTAWLAVRIHDATGGQVSIKELLPDVYQRVEAELGERVLLP